MLDAPKASSDCRLVLMLSCALFNTPSSIVLFRIDQMQISTYPLVDRWKREAQSLAVCSFIFLHVSCMPHSPFIPYSLHGEHSTRYTSLPNYSGSGRVQAADAYSQRNLAQHHVPYGANPLGS